LVFLGENISIVIEMLGKNLPPKVYCFRSLIQIDINLLNYQYLRDRTEVKRQKSPPGCEFLVSIIPYLWGSPIALPLDIID
jgi:hypothetical protein